MFTIVKFAGRAPVTSGSRLSGMAPCLVVEETDDPLQISNLTVGSRGNLRQTTDERPKF